MPVTSVIGCGEPGVKEGCVYYYLFLGLLTLTVLVWTVAAILDQDPRDKP